ncbi:T9SS type A sorting domain-containing protein [Chryseobacterium pennipullorum]|uniref:T9SS type A sorting domain-containing protein n=1 Tax=Chryseobacterium pennipullorum TaxID=2258963 RepID=UPI001E3A76E2|nr:T9SS type A sorting domain-containing protein [Chryseobacterium pennipullorum]
MKKLYMNHSILLCAILGLSVQEVVWQKNIKSSTLDFLIEVITTRDRQYLITGNSIQSGSKRHNGYDCKEAEILVYDMSGRQLKNPKTKNKVTKINTQALGQGAYVVTIKTDTNKTANAKLI